MASELTNKQQRFVDEYMVDLNARQAAIRAGYSERSAHKIGCELLTKPKVMKEIERRKQDLHKDAIMRREEVLERLTQIATGKTVIPIHYESTKEVDGKKSKRKTTGKKAPESEEQLRALEMLGKHYGLFTDKKEVSFEGAVVFEDDI